MGEAETPLADMLRLAEWGPRQLVTAINSRLSSQGRERLRLDPTAGYSWVKRGFRPRAPIPDVAAAVLTERLGEATAAAADGDLARFRHQSQAAAVLLQRHAASDAPSFLYYLTPEQLAAEAGQALVVLAERIERVEVTVADDLGCWRGPVAGQPSRRAR